MRVLGIDVGGTTVKWVVFDALAGRVVAHGALPTAGSPRAVAADLAGLVEVADAAVDAAVGPATDMAVDPAGRGGARGVREAERLGAVLAAQVRAASHGPVEPAEITAGAAAGGTAAGSTAGGTGEGAAMGSTATSAAVDRLTADAVKGSTATGAAMGRAAGAAVTSVAVDAAMGRTAAGAAVGRTAAGAAVGRTAAGAAVDRLTADAGGYSAGTQTAGRLREGGARIGAIGVGVPGHVDRRTGVVRFIPNLAGAWPGFPLAGTLSAATGRPVTVLNDARALCLAEWRLGAARGHDDALFLTLGTGVGGGVVSGGRLLTGPDDRLGEIGHLTYDREGPECGCGHRGCLETYASATAIARAAGRDTAADAFLAPTDPRAQAAVERAGRAIGETIASLCAVLPTDLLVVGGGVAAGLPRLRPSIETALAERRDFIGVVDVVAARLGPDAGAVGAALAAAALTTTDGGGRELDQASA